MNNENCNYTYRGYNIVIRNDNGVVRIGKTIFTSINNHPTNGLRSEEHTSELKPLVG